MRFSESGSRHQAFQLADAPLRHGVCNPRIILRAPCSMLDVASSCYYSPFSMLREELRRVWR